MKKLFVYAGIACAAALSLTNCSKIEPQTPSSEGMPFEIVASTAETKTANNGLKTTWVEGDALNLFHAEAGSTTTYGTNDEFTFVSGENFSGKLTKELDASKSYDWYALYPVNTNEKYLVTSPTGEGDGWTYIGHKGGADQKGYNSTAHLSGTLCPLYGVAKNVKGSAPVKITMKHITSVVKIVVTNENETPLTINTVTFTAPEDIVGSYKINFTDPSNVVCTKSGDIYVSATATLNVSGGTALAKGESAAFYIPVKPFTAAKGSELKITVNGYEKAKTLDTDKEFVAGTIHKLGFSYDKKASTSKYATTYTNNVTLAANNGTNASEAEIVISGTTYQGLKMGTSKKGGSASVFVPANTKKLHIHAVGWNGTATPTVTISGATSSPNTLTLSPDTGVAKNTPFTLQGNASDYYYELTLSDIKEGTTITFTSDKRFLLFGVNAE